MAYFVEQNVLCSIFYMSFLTFFHSEALTIEKKCPDINIASYIEIDSLKFTPAPSDFNLHGKFSNDFVSKLGSDYILKSGPVKVSFVCNSYHPTYWTFPHINQLPNNSYERIDSDEKRVAKFSSEIKSPLNYKFINTITILLSELKFLSLNLTCSSVENKSWESSIHVFLQGNVSLENEEKVITMEFSASKNPDSTFVIPCRVSTPNTSTVLEVQERNSWKLINSLSMVYNPKIGYLVNRKKLANDFHMQNVTRLYRCSTNAKPEEQSRVYFNITLVNTTVTENSDMPLSIILPLKNITDGNGNISVSKNDFGSTEVTCCSGVDSIPPNMSTWVCNSAVACRLTKMHLLSGRPEIENHVIGREEVESNCKINPIFDATVYVTCKSSQFDFVATLVQMFKLTTYKTGGADKDEESRPSWKKSLTSYQVPINVTVAQKMAVFVGQHKFIFNEAPVLFPGTSPEETTEGTDNTIYIKEYSRNIFYVGEPLLLFCVGVKHFYAKGALLTLTWENGTQTALPKPSENSPLELEDKLVRLREEFNMFDGHSLDTQYVFAEAVNAEFGMRSINCWMPLMESTEWDTTSKQIKILPSIAPRFLEQDEETVYLDEESKLISCKISQGELDPILQVFWNEKLIEAFDKEDGGIDMDKPIAIEYLFQSSSVAEVKIRLKRTEHGYYSVLKCMATNANGTAIRTVLIIVPDESHTSWALIWGGIGVLFAVVCTLIVLAEKHGSKKRHQTEAIK